MYFPPHPTFLFYRVLVPAAATPPNPTPTHTSDGLRFHSTFYVQYSMTADSDLCHVLNTTFTTTVNPATMVLVGFWNLVIPLVAPLAIFLYLNFCMMLLLLVVDMGLSTAIWPTIRGCYWILNIIGGSSRYRRKAMKLSYRWLSYSGSTCLHWSFNRAVNTQWTPMNLDQINVPDEPPLTPQVCSSPCPGGGKFCLH